MQFFVLSTTVLIFFAAVIVLSYFGKKSDDKKRRLDFIQDMGANKNTPGSETSFFERYLKRILRKLTLFFNKTTPANKTHKNKAKNILIENQLRLAGVFMSAQEFISIKTTFLMVALVISMLAFLLSFDLQTKAFIFLLIAVIGISGPTLFLRSKVKGHQEQIRQQLPDVMDLLSVCIEAGLSFDISLLKVAEKLKGAFVDELMIVHREIQMGRTRREALQNMVACTDIAELKTFVSALIQAEALGIPIINVMRIQSSQLRMVRKQQAQEKGMKSPVKMLIPMVMFIFPVIFIILLGPTVINIMTSGAF